MPGTESSKSLQCKKHTESRAAVEGDFSLALGLCLLTTTLQHDNTTGRTGKAMAI